MALKPPVPGLTAKDSGLRRISYDATSAAKVNLIVQPGDELDVSDDVAAQLLASSPQFKTEIGDSPTTAEVDDTTAELVDPEGPEPAHLSEVVDLEHLDRDQLLAYAEENDIAVNRRLGEAKLRDAITAAQLPPAVSAES